MPEIRQTERRIARLADLAIERRAEGEAGGRLIGHAAMFDELSEDLGGFREQIRRGAFAASIARDDIRALFNHDPNVVLGRNRAGTLRLEEDRQGLRVEIELPDTQAARDLAASVARGDVTQQSFGFRTVEDEWEERAGDVVRTLVEVELFDISPVVFPAYPQTDIAVRALTSWQEGCAAEAEAVAAVLRRLESRQRQARAEL